MCGSCGQPPILVRNVVRGVAGQIVVVEGGGARGQLDETEQDAGDRGFPRPVRPDQANPSSRRQVEIDAIQSEPVAGPVPDLRAAQRDPYRARGQRPGRGRLADRVGRVQDGRDPATRHPGLPELDRRGGQGGDDLEGGERRERQHGQRDPGQRAVSGGCDPQQQDAPEGQPSDRGTQARGQARHGRVPIGLPGHVPVGRGHRDQRGVLGAVGVQLGRARQQVAERGGQLAPGRSQAPRGAARRDGGEHRDADPGGQQADGEQNSGGRENQQAGDDRAGASQRGGQRRGYAPDEQVLRRVDVGDQPGEQVAGGERGQPASASRSSRR